MASIGCLTRRGLATAACAVALLCACSKSEQLGPTLPTVGVPADAAPGSETNASDENGEAGGERLPGPGSGEPDPALEATEVIRALEAREDGALERAATFLDRAADVQDGTADLDPGPAGAWIVEGERVFAAIERRQAADDLIGLWALVDASAESLRDRVISGLRMMHDPRVAVRDVLAEAVERLSPPEGALGLYVDENDDFILRGMRYLNAVVAMAEVLDERAVPHLESMLELLSRMVRITDEQANLYDAGLLLLAAIAIRAGGAVEEHVVQLVLELTDPDKYPERWVEKRATKLRVLSFIGADLWGRFGPAQAECAEGNPRGRRRGHAADCPGTVESLPGADSADGADADLDHVKHRGLRGLLDDESLDVRERIHYVLKLFACPIEVSMGTVMMDRNNPAIRAFERWCGDYGAAAESLGRLAHAETGSLREDAIEFLAARLDRGFFRHPETGEPIPYDEYMNQEIYNYVMFRQAMAKALGYLGVPDVRALAALRTVVFDETDHPQVGRSAGKSLGIVADARTLGRIVEAFVSPATNVDVRGCLFQALDGYFRFAPLDSRAPIVPGARDQAVAELVRFAATYAGGVAELPTTRMFVLGAWFGSAAVDARATAPLAELVRGENAAVREIALLGLIGSADAAAARPIFDQVFGSAAPPDPAVAALREPVVVRTLVSVFTNEGSSHDPYVLTVRAASEVADGTLFRRLEVLAALRDLGRPEFLDSCYGALALPICGARDSLDRTCADAGLEAESPLRWIATSLADRDNFTNFETPYLTWLEAIRTFVADAAGDHGQRRLAVELLVGIGESGYVRAIREALDVDGADEADRVLCESIDSLLQTGTERPEPARREGGAT